MCVIEHIDQVEDRGAVATDEQASVYERYGQVMSTQ